MAPRTRSEEMRAAPARQPRHDTPPENIDTVPEPPITAPPPITRQATPFPGHAFSAPQPAAEPPKVGLDTTVHTTPGFVAWIVTGLVGIIISLGGTWLTSRLAFADTARTANEAAATNKEQDAQLKAHEKELIELKATFKSIDEKLAELKKDQKTALDEFKKDQKDALQAINDKLDRRK